MRELGKLLFLKCNVRFNNINYLHSSEKSAQARGTLNVTSHMISHSSLIWKNYLKCMVLLKKSWKHSRHLSAAKQYIIFYTSLCVM